MPVCAAGLRPAPVVCVLLSHLLRRTWAEGKWNGGCGVWDQFGTLEEQGLVLGCCCDMLVLGWVQLSPGAHSRWAAQLWRVDEAACTPDQVLAFGASKGVLALEPLHRACAHLSQAGWKKCTSYARRWQQVYRGRWLSQLLLGL
jgi:hypothetical protein